MLISPGRKHFPRNIIIAIIYMNLHHLHSLCYKKQPSLYSSPQIFLEHGYSGKSLSFSRLCSECLWFGFAIFKNVITLRTCGWVSVPQPWIFFPGETWAALSHDREKCQVSWEKTFWHLLHRLGKKKQTLERPKFNPIQQHQEVLSEGGSSPSYVLHNRLIMAITTLVPLYPSIFPV